jgi:hypothetical protein
LFADFHDDRDALEAVAMVRRALQPASHEPGGQQGCVIGQTKAHRVWRMRRDRTRNASHGARRAWPTMRG